MQLQILHWLEVGLIDPVLGYRHLHVCIGLDGVDLFHNLIGHLNQESCVLWLHEMCVSEVAVAEMIAKLDAGVYSRRKAGQSIKYSSLDR